MDVYKLNTGNFAGARLVRNVTKRDETLIVETTINLPEVPFRVTINQEVIEVGRTSKNKLMDIKRGLEDTKPWNHQAGDSVMVTWTDEMLRKLSKNIKSTQNVIQEATEDNQFLSVRGVRRFG